MYLNKRESDEDTYPPSALCFKSMRFYKEDLKMHTLYIHTICGISWRYLVVKPLQASNISGGLYDSKNQDE